MSNKKRWQVPKILYKREKKEIGSDVNPNKKVHARDFHDLLASHISKPVGCKLPEIGNSRAIKQHTGNTMHTSSGEVARTHLPLLPVKAYAQQQVKSKCSSASSLRLDSQHSQQDRHGFEELKLPTILAVVKQDCGNNKGSMLAQKKLLHVHLPSIMTQSSSWAAGHKPGMIALRPTTDLESICKLPEIKNNLVKCSRPVCGNLHRPSCVLPPISQRTDEPDKNRNCKYAEDSESQNAQSKKEKRK